MALLGSKHYITQEEYLRIEREAEFKSEYYDGEMFAMAGGTRRHSLLITNAITALGVGLRGSKCHVYDSNLRANIPASGLYTYPDVSVVCSPFEHSVLDEDTVTNPRVIVEVLSDSTEGYDRGTRFEHYRTLATLEEYVLISQKAPLVEVFARQDDGTWKLRPVAAWKPRHGWSRSASNCASPRFTTAWFSRKRRRSKSRRGNGRDVPAGGRRRANCSLRAHVSPLLRLFRAASLPRCARLLCAELRLLFAGSPGRFPRR